jgi:hypothetical protein
MTDAPKMPEPQKPDNALPKALKKESRQEKEANLRQLRRKHWYLTNNNMSLSPEESIRRESDLEHQADQLRKELKS